jgi:hypothetical protein
LDGEEEFGEGLRDPMSLMRYALSCGSATCTRERHTFLIDDIEDAGVGAPARRTPMLRTVADEPARGPMVRNDTTATRSPTGIGPAGRRWSRRGSTTSGSMQIPEEPEGG